MAKKKKFFTHENILKIIITVSSIILVLSSLAPLLFIH